MSIITKHLEVVSKVDRTGFYSWILENGKFYEDVTEINIDGMDIRKKQCFRNAQLAFFGAGMPYVEGYYMCKTILIPLAHAWNDLNGQAVDVTAQKFKFNVVARFGVEIPDDFMLNYFDNPGIHSPLKTYYERVIRRK